ncbi:hypothetical protein ACED35_24165, partial [Enterovibrio norvegicus]
THNPTRSNDTQATSVSPLGHESSPKNDSSESTLMTNLNILLVDAESANLGAQRDDLDFNLSQLGMKYWELLIDIELSQDDRARELEEKICAIQRYCDEAKELIELGISVGLLQVKGVKICLMQKSEGVKNEK